MNGSVNPSLPAEHLVPFLAAIFGRRGGEEYLGEQVTMSEHMLQAAQLAEQAGEGETLVVAALLHDIGHFTSEFGMFSLSDVEDRYHEDAGAELLARFLPTVVTDCVRCHVAAKRYLCAVDPEYFAQLSAASVHSLHLQGGPMSNAERIAFEKEPNLQAIVTVRRHDDAAKIAGLPTPPFAHYADAIQRLVDSHRNATPG